MIFVTVGTQLPFDRLVRAIDRWAAVHPGHEIVAQVGDSDLECSTLEVVQDLDPAEYEELMERCTHVVAHAGTGSILTALAHGKPVLIVPRDVQRGEVRSDHQVHTARAFQGLPGVRVLEQIEDLEEVLPAFLEAPAPAPPVRHGGRQGEERDLPAAIRAVVDGARVRSSGAGSQRVLCASSTGGHLSEMLQILPELEGKDIIVLTSRASDAHAVARYRHHAVREASRWSRSKGLWTFVQFLVAVLRFRPDVVLSTGAAPGFFAAVAGRLTGARVIWVDSMANVSEVSLAGRLARRFSHAFFVQWEALADPASRFAGRLIPPMPRVEEVRDLAPPPAPSRGATDHDAVAEPQAPKVFLTVGVQLPHERLVRELDRWAAAEGVSVVAQIGSCSYRPQAFTEVHASLDERAYRSVMEDCTHVVAHAGVGTILSARDLGKPLLVVPRLAALGEHRSDHQRATARKLEGATGVLVCEDLSQLDSAMGDLLTRTRVGVASDGGTLSPLLTALEAFLLEGPLPA